MGANPRQRRVSVNAAAILVVEEEEQEGVPAETEEAGDPVVEEGPGTAASAVFVQHMGPPHRHLSYH